MKFLKPALVAFVVIGILAVWSSQARGELSESEAREYVKRGARIVDVRTVEEFNAKRLTNAVNIPLAEVKEQFPRVVTNKSDVVLLHCRTGRRSGIAESELRALGYTNVFNIGSLERADKVLKAAGR